MSAVTFSLALYTVAVIAIVIIFFSTGSNGGKK